MPYITLESHLPGVTGLLEYRKDTGDLLRELTQVLLRGPSTLTEAERELIATIVSHKNNCNYCTLSHTAAADAFLGEYETSSQVKQDLEESSVGEKMKALLTIAAQVQENGKCVRPETVERAKHAGASEAEIHDTVLIAALFSMYNRYVDGLATIAPAEDDYYKSMAERLKNKGYYRPPGGYDHLKA